MNQFMEIRPSGGKVVLCSLFAAVLGLLQPFAVMFQLVLPMPGISLAMIAAAVMYGSAGMVPAAVLGILSAASLLFVFGAKLGVMAVLLWMIPAATIVIGIRRKEAFFRQLTKGIAAAVAAVVLAVAAAAGAYGSDAISLAVNQLRDTFTGQQELFWQMLSGSPAFQGATFEEFVEMYYVMFNTLELYYDYYLMSNLLTGAVASAAIGVLWGNWKVARRGGATPESYRGLNQWYLPGNTTWGLLMMLAAGFVLAKTSLPGAESAWIVVSSLCQLAFVIQCAAAMDRRMRRSGSGSGARKAMILFLIGLSYIGGSVTILAITGAASALFGSKGAAKPLINKFKDNTDGKDR